MRWPDKNHKALLRLGILLVGIGALLAIDTITKTPVVYRLWPILVLVMGGGLIEIFRRRGRRESAYLICGIILLGFGSLALYLNFTDWAMMATLWPSFIGFLGAGLVCAYIFSRRRKAFLLLGLLLLSLAFGFVFVFAVQPQLWWTIFVLAGISILITEWTT